MIINYNSENLRYLFIDIDKYNINVSLDITQVFPKHLRVYFIRYVHNYTYKHIYSGSITESN